jgi:hypothetical protein
MIPRTDATHRPHFVVPRALKEETTLSCKILPELTALYPEIGSIFFLRNNGTKLLEDTTLLPVKEEEISLSVLFTTS